MTGIPSSPESFDRPWLEEVLGGPPDSLRGFEYSAIGTGQIADSYRVELDWIEASDRLPASLVAKCASPDETSLASARLLGLYTKEVNWYRELAAESSVRAPRCYHSALNPEGDQFILLLEDCSPGEQGDQLAGATEPDVLAALDEAARLHAPLTGRPELETREWLRIDPEAAAMRKGFIGQFWPDFRERYRDRLAPELFEMGDAFIERLLRTDDIPELVSVAHGDFRIDNMLFGANGGRVVILDWQTVYPGHPLCDVSYLIGTSIADPDERRAKEEAWVGHYCEQMAALGTPIPWNEAWTAYRRYASAGFLMAITASMLAKRTERGDEMFAVMAERPARQMIDLDTLSLY